MTAVKESYNELAYIALKKHGKPMHYRDITAEVVKFKREVGNTPSQSLRVAISKDKRFVKTSRGIYGLAEWHH
jgi:DNA-directed RNA polymerase delta subunit